MQKKGANIRTGNTNYCVNEAAATAAAALSPLLSLLKKNAITSSILHFKPRNAHQNAKNLKWNGDTELKSQRNRRRRHKSGIKMQQTQSQKRRRQHVRASAIRKRVREKDDPIWMKKRTYVDEKRELLEMRDLMSTEKCFKDEIRFFIWFF